MEYLVIYLSYKSDIIYRYRSNKRINLKIEFENLSDEDSIYSMEQYIDLIFMMRNKEFEIENNIIQKI